MKTKHRLILFAINHHTILSHTIQPNTIQPNTIQPNTIQTLIRNIITLPKKVPLHPYLCHSICTVFNVKMTHSPIRLFRALEQDKHMIKMIIRTIFQQQK